MVRWKLFKWDCTFTHNTILYIYIYNSKKIVHGFDNQFSYLKTRTQLGMGHLGHYSSSTWSHLLLRVHIFAWLGLFTNFVFALWFDDFCLSDFGVSSEFNHIWFFYLMHTNEKAEIQLYVAAVITTRLPYQWIIGYKYTKQKWWCQHCQISDGTSLHWGLLSVRKHYHLLFTVLWGFVFSWYSTLCHREYTTKYTAYHQHAHRHSVTA